MDLTIENSQNKQVLNYLQNLEKRIAQIESHLDIESEQTTEQIEQKLITPNSVTDSSEALEFKIGQFWLFAVQRSFV